MWAGQARHGHGLAHDDGLRAEILNSRRHGVVVGHGQRDEAAIIGEDGRLIEGVAEVLVHEQLVARADVGEVDVVGWRGHGSAEGLFQAVVANQMVRHALEVDADCLLDQAVLLEGIRVDQRAHQRSLRVGRLTRAHDVADCCKGGAVTLAIGTVGPVDAAIALLLLLESPLLLSGGERLLQLAVDEEVAEDAAGAPGDAVGPALDARGMLFVDEDVSAGNEVLAFAVMGAARNVRDAALQASLKEDGRIHGGGYMAIEGRRERCYGSRHGDLVHVSRNLVLGVFWVLGFLMFFFAFFFCLFCFGFCCSISRKV